MLKFLVRENYYNTINTWIRDGSNLESTGHWEDGEWVVLRGADGAREELYLFHDQEAYDDAVDCIPGE